MNLEYIINKGCVKDLSLDLSAVCVTEELLSSRYDHKYTNTIVSSLTRCIEIKYDITGDDVKINFMTYHSKVLRNE